MSEQTVLVTGATGFLGSHLVKSLLKQNYQVIVLKRSFSNTWRIKNVLPQLIAFDIDVCEISDPFKQVSTIDAIIHTATCYGRNNETTSNIFTTNTVFPLNLLEITSFFNVKAFINTDTSINKHSIPYQGLSPYSLSKYQFTQWGKYFASMSEMKFINVSVEYMFGPYDNRSNLVNYVIEGCLNNVKNIKLTGGDQQRDFIYINDVVSAYLVLLNNIEQIPQNYSEYELGCGRLISLKKFIKIIHRLTDSQSQLNFGVLPYRKGEIMHSQADIQALNQLGWFPQWKLKDALTETIRTFRNN